jgi:hypothetical protein
MHRNCAGVFRVLRSRSCCRRGNMTEAPVNAGFAAESPDALPAETGEAVAAAEQATPGAILRRARRRAASRLPMSCR